MAAVWKARGPGQRQQLLAAAASPQGCGILVKGSCLVGSRATDGGS